MGVDEALLGRVRSAMHALRPAGHYDKVHKDECMFSFDSPESPGGLYVNLTSLQVRFEVAFRCQRLHAGQCRFRTW